MPTAIIDAPLTWLCTECKRRVFNHIEFCQCGQARPAPVEPKQPDDTAPLVEEVITGAMDRFARQLRESLAIGAR